jgi:hypothetical protein
MSDSVFFVLTAISHSAGVWFRHKHNKMYYVPPRDEAFTVSSRACTPATNTGHEDEEDGRNESSEDHGEQLRFTLNMRPKNEEKGYVFGSSRSSDVLIGSSEGGISRSHFRITLNKHEQVVLVDSSGWGTAVSYDSQARKEKRRRVQHKTGSFDKSNDFTWIMLPGVNDIRVVIGEDIPSLPGATMIEFSVKVVDPLFESSTYRALRTAYVEDMQNAIPFSLYCDSNPTTAGQTQLHSPTRQRQRPIWINGSLIDEGAFGMVYKVHDVSTGAVYAAKSLFPNNHQRNNERNNKRDIWEREVTIMRDLSHVRHPYCKHSDF